METQVAPLLPGGIEPLWGMKDVMDYLGFGYTKTWRLIHEFGLPGYQMGDKTSPWRFNPDEVRAWTEQYRDVLRPRKVAS